MILLHALSAGTSISKLKSTLHTDRGTNWKEEGCIQHGKKVESYLDVGDVAKGAEGLEQDLLIHCRRQVAHVQRGDRLRGSICSALRHQQIPWRSQHGTCSDTMLLILALNRTLASTTENLKIAY